MTNELPTAPKQESTLPAEQKETPPATATFDCSGSKIGGGCWFLAPELTSCQSHCSSLGLTYDSLTCSYGNDKLSNCGDIIDSFNRPLNPTAFEIRNDSAIGCMISGDIFFFVSNSCTADATPGNEEQRACACTSDSN